MEVLVLLIIFFGFIFIMLSNISSKETAEVRSKDLDELLVKMRGEVVSVTVGYITGKEINQVIGMVRGVSDIKFNSLS
jgi:hypothetical protein